MTEWNPNGDYDLLPDNSAPSGAQERCTDQWHQQETKPTPYCASCGSRSLSPYFGARAQERECDHEWHYLHDDGLGQEKRTHYVCRLCTARLNLPFKANRNLRKSLAPQPQPERERCTCGAACTGCGSTSASAYGYGICTDCKPGELWQRHRARTTQDERP